MGTAAAPPPGRAATDPARRRGPGRGELQDRVPGGQRRARGLRRAGRAGPPGHRRAGVPARTRAPAACAAAAAGPPRSRCCWRTWRTRTRRRSSGPSRTRPPRAACWSSPAAWTRTRPGSGSWSAPSPPAGWTACCSCRPARTRRYLEREVRAGTAIVCLDREARGLPVDSVVTTNATGAAEGVRHLAAAGHRRIAYLGDRAGDPHRPAAAPGLPRGARPARRPGRRVAGRARPARPADRRRRGDPAAWTGRTRPPRCSPRRTW